jgi:hypothetical protein
VPTLIGREPRAPDALVNSFELVAAAANSLMVL